MVGEVNQYYCPNTSIKECCSLIVAEKTQEKNTLHDIFITKHHETMDAR